MVLKIGPLALRDLFAKTVLKLIASLENKKTSRRM